jgi:hypothetical protein
LKLFPRVGEGMFAGELPLELLALWWRELRLFQREEERRREARARRDARLIAKCGHGDEKACLALKLSPPSWRPLSERAALHQLSQIRHALDMAVIGFHARGDGEGLLRLLRALPPQLRRWYFGEGDAPQRWCRELLGEEVVEALKRSRAEVKVVLSDEEVLRAIELWGAEWREKLREIAGRAVRERLLG